MAFPALYQNIPKMLTMIQVGASRWPLYERKVMEMIIQPASSKPGLVSGTVVLLENYITMRVTEPHKRMKYRKFIIQLYPKFKERFVTTLPFIFSLDVKSMKIPSEVESPSGVS
ncbi:hypothetical protein TNCV_373891 [Trichonephila clavipes]|nr:hypothetical protein TNCV_373891 [Trichonephila clavipes]